MNGRNTFNLWFYTRNNRPNRNGKVPIYLRITVSGKESTISINRNINPSAWDNIRSCIKQRTSEADELNPYLETLREKATEAHRQLILDGKPVTPDAIVSIILKRKEREFTLVKLMEHHNKEMELSLGISSSKGNYKNFKTSLRYIREFIEKIYRQQDFLLSELDTGFIDKYCLFLRQQKNCQHNGAMKQIQRLKKVVSVGVSLGWIRKDPFASYKIKFKPYDKIILTAEELSTLENLNGLTLKLELVRDAFVFSCYTGLAYIDLKNLSWDKIVNGVDGTPWIVTRRSKTETKSRIPLLPQPISIMGKYKGHKKLKDDKVIPIYSNQKTNDYLKDLAKLAGIEKSLSFHTARHVFATVVTLSNGVPIETVSKALGHKDIRTTQVYSRILDEKIATDFSRLREKFVKSTTTPQL